VYTNKLEKNIINISALTFLSMPLSNISNFPNEIKQTLISAGHDIAFFVLKVPLNSNQPKLLHKYATGALHAESSSV